MACSLPPVQAPLVQREVLSVAAVELVAEGSRPGADLAVAVQVKIALLHVVQAPQFAATVTCVIVRDTGVGVLVGVWAVWAYWSACWSAWAY